MTKKIDNTNYRQGYEATGTLIDYWRQCEIAHTTTVENSLIISFKVKHTLIYNSEISKILGIYPRKMKTYDHTRTLYMNVHSSVNQNRPKWKQPKYLLTDKWLNKLWVYSYNTTQQ